MELAPKEEWLRLDAPTFRAVWPAPAAAKKQGEAWKMPVEVTAAVLQSLHSAPVKCSLSSSRERDIDPEQATTHFHFLESAGRIFALGFEADRQLDSLVCEMAFGGVGIEQGPEDHNRPASTAEGRVRRHVLQKIASALAAKWAEAREQAFAVLDEAMVRERKLVAPRGNYICGTCLINVFGMSAEILLLLPEEQFQHLQPVEATPLTTKAEAKTKVSIERCPFVLTAALPEQQMGLREILSLKEGDVLHLQASHASPLLLSCGGRPLYAGNFRLEGDAYEILILDPPTLKDAA